MSNVSPDVSTIPPPSIGTYLGKIKINGNGVMVFHNEPNPVTLTNSIGYVTNKTGAKLWVELSYGTGADAFSQVARLHDGGHCFLVVDENDTTTVTVSTSPSTSSELPNNFTPIPGTGTVNVVSEEVPNTNEVSITGSGNNLTADIAIALAPASYVEGKYNLKLINKTGEDIQICLNGGTPVPLQVTQGDPTPSHWVAMENAVNQWIIGFEQYPPPAEAPAVWSVKDDPQIVVKRPKTLST